MVGDSVLLKQNSNYYEHFYTDLLSNVHYIPLKSDLSDLIDKIKWAIQNDAEVNSFIFFQYIKL